MPQLTKASATTHLPLLIRAFDFSEGDVLELGTGYFSTLILDWLANITKRTVYSYDHDAKWIRRAQQIARKSGDLHKVILCEDWDKADFDQKHWGLVFVDHHPMYRRSVEIARLANHADYIVAHDTNGTFDRHYGYSSIWGLFKYRYDYTKMWPSTTVLSNFKDLREFEL